MPHIVSLEAGYYRVPLEVGLSDSMHGEMLAFELNTLRLRDGDGAEGMGYTYTCGRNGAAIDAILARDLPSQMIGQEADRIEHLWQRIWWGQHYGGRGGAAVLAQSAADMALWDLKGRRLGQPLWTLLGGHDPRVLCYAGGIDLDLPLDRRCCQVDAWGAGSAFAKLKVIRQPRLRSRFARRRTRHHERHDIQRRKGDDGGAGNGCGSDCGWRGIAVRGGPT